MRAFIWPLVLSGCTFVVGSAPHVESDAATNDDAGTDEASSPADGSLEDVAVEAACSVPTCNAAKDACKKACDSAAKTCNDGCSEEDGKSCHALCNQQQQACNGSCLATCLQCVTGCGTCGP